MFIIVGLVLLAGGSFAYFTYKTPEGVTPMGGNDETIAIVGLVSSILGLVSSVVGLIATFRKK